MPKYWSGDIISTEIMTMIIRGTVPKRYSKVVLCMHAYIPMIAVYLLQQSTCNSCSTLHQYMAFAARVLIYSLGLPSGIY